MIEVMDEAIKALLAGYAAEMARISIAANSNRTGVTDTSKKIVVEIKENVFVERSVKQFDEIYNWASKTYTFDYLNPLETADSTITLNISQKLKRQRKEKETEQIIDEEKLLSNKDNVILIGDPGSGKTTTIKRLLLSNFFSPRLENNPFKFPILIVCRNLEIEKPIEVIIAENIGLPLNFRSNASTDRQNFVDLQEKIHYTSNYYFGDIPLIDYLKEVFEQFEVLLIIEGFDEIKFKNVDYLITGIDFLGKKLKKAKIVMTCRPSFMSRRLESFNYYQLCELSPEHIEAIAGLFVENVPSFLSALENKSYADLSTRPLFLTYLLLLFNSKSSTEGLPESSKEVYEEIVDFYLKQWDRERGVDRESKYSLARPIRKREFLSHLSFLLTYKIKSKVFDRGDLIDAYNKIAPTLGLPTDEAEEVAEEIETHTGIIVKSYGINYEFSHLSLQEYLTANYLVRNPFSPEIKTYFKEYPPPLALTIALASNPSEWFINITKGVFYQLRENTEYFTSSAAILFRRLNLENPYFEPSTELGIAVLLICDLCDSNNSEFTKSLEQFVLTRESVVKSVKNAIEHYTILAPERPKFHKIRFVRKANKEKKHQLNYCYF